MFNSYITYNYQQTDKLRKVIALSAIALLVNAAINAGVVIVVAALAHIGWNLI